MAGCYSFGRSRLAAVRRRASVLAALAAALVVVACGGREERGPNGELKLRGTVHAVQGRDGSACWRFDAESGTEYELQGAQAPRELRVDGLRATILAKPRKGGSFCQVGQLLDVVKVDSAAGPAR